MASFQYMLNDVPLSSDEKGQMEAHVHSLGLDGSIWGLYDALLLTRSKYSIPLILRVNAGNDLVAAVILIRCFDHGATLTSFKPLANSMKYLRMPAYIWMRSGIGAEILANPGFVNLKYEYDEVIKGIIQYISKHCFLAFILDLKERANLYPGSVQLPYPDEGVIDIREVQSAENYISLHGNIKKKIRHYRNKGGVIEIIHGALDPETRQMIGRCVELTALKSAFKLPYQENYPRMCMESAAIKDDSIVHFICKSDQDFFGYHSFIRFESQLRCLNGAFNRELRTTHHAYENMILKVVEYAALSGIEKVYFGPVLNETKRRMMHEFLPNNLYFNSNNELLRTIFPTVLKNSRMMNKDVMRFAGSEEIKNR